MPDLESQEVSGTREVEERWKRASGTAVQQESRKGGNGTKQRKTEKERRGRSVRLNGRNTEMNIRHRPCYPLLRGAGRRGAGSSCPSSQGQRKAEEPEESKTQKYQTTWRFRWFDTDVLQGARERLVEGEAGYWQGRYQEELFMTSPRL